MNRTIQIVGGVLLAITLAACSHGNGRSPGAITVKDADGNSVNVVDSSRIVSVGTPGTETLYALGAGSRLVGVDNSSSEYIKEAAHLPQIGTRTALSAEGILSLRPTLVVFSVDAGPPQVIEQLRSAGVTTLVLPSDFTIDVVKQKIQTIAEAVGLGPKGAEVNRSIDKEIADIEAQIAGTTSRPKVLFVGRGPNMPNATMSGSGTTIDELIRLAGGVNPMSSFQGFKEMTDEAVISAAPDVILMTEKSFARSGGVDGVLTFPGVKLTGAGKNRRVVTVSDMYFQGFGPAVCKAVSELMFKLHPELVRNNQDSRTSVEDRR
jgi:iron complex transport system substrate-binding protein